MEIGIQVPNFTYPNGKYSIRPVLKDIATTVDKGDFPSLWVMDHYLQIGLSDPFPNKPTDEMLEGYSTLNYFAGITERVKLGTMVTGVIYRNPGFLLKQVTSLDVLSGGRSWFGIGAAWFEREAKAYGFPFPPVKQRFEMLEEVLQISKQYWSPNNGEYEGKHYKLKETICSPQPIQEPHPPILIGGMGETKTLKFVARYADATNLFMRAGLDVIKSKLDILKKHCSDENRDYSEIEKTIIGSIHLAGGKMTPNDVINQLKPFAEIGIDVSILNMPNIYKIEPLHTLQDEILPAIADL